MLIMGSLIMYEHFLLLVQLSMHVHAADIGKQVILSITATSGGAYGGMIPAMFEGSD